MGMCVNCVSTNLIHTTMQTHTHTEKASHSARCRGGKLSDRLTITQELYSQVLQPYRRVIVGAREKITLTQHSYIARGGVADGLGVGGQCGGSGCDAVSATSKVASQRY